MLKVLKCRFETGKRPNEWYRCRTSGLEAGAEVVDEDVKTHKVEDARCVVKSRPVASASGASSHVAVLTIPARNFVHPQVFAVDSHI